MSNNILPALFIAASLVSSCSKNYTSGAGPYSGSAAVFDSLGGSSTTTTFDAAAGGTFTSQSGTRYVFPANAFKTANGTPVSGEVQVKATEFLTRSAIMSSSVFPVSDNDPLVSSGEFNITVSQGDQELSLMPPNIVQIVMPRHDTLTGMQLYFGNKTPNGSSIVNWQLNTDSAQGSIQYESNNLVITTTQTGYINADKPMIGSTSDYSKNRSFYSLGNFGYQAISVSITSTEGIGDDKDIKGFVCYDNCFGMYPMTGVKFGKISWDRVLNAPVHIVVTMVHHGYFYAGSLPVTPQDGANYRLNLTKTTPEGFKTLVNNL